MKIKRAKHDKGRSAVYFTRLKARHGKIVEAFLAKGGQGVPDLYVHLRQCEDPKPPPSMTIEDLIGLLWLLDYNVTKTGRIVPKPRKETKPK